MKKFKAWVSTSGLAFNTSVLAKNREDALKKVYERYIPERYHVSIEG